MMEKKKTYIAIDLKSFYASVECKERNRDPLTTNLVVADKSTSQIKIRKLWRTYNHVKRRVFDYRYAAESADGFCNADDSWQLFSAGIQYG